MKVGPVVVCFVITALAGAFLLAGATPARAYSIEGGAASGSTRGNFNLDFNGLLAPLQNFFQSINSVGNTNFIPWTGTSAPGNGSTSPLPPPSGPLDSGVNSAIQNAFQRFDTWFYGIAGFHVIGLLDVILAIISWLLGVVQGIVNWLQGVLQHHYIINSRPLL